PAALLDRGVQKPADHLVLASCGRIATLVASDAPLGAEDLRHLDEAAQKYGFQILAAPGHTPAFPLLGAIANSQSPQALSEVIRDDLVDYSPPTDERPYFFSTIKASVIPFILRNGRSSFHSERGNQLRGNLLAMLTLGMLGLTA